MQSLPLSSPSFFVCLFLVTFYFIFPIKKTAILELLMFLNEKENESEDNFLYSPQLCIFEISVQCKSDP